MVETSQKVMEIPALLELIEQEVESLENIYCGENVIDQPPSVEQVAQHKLTALSEAQKKLDQISTQSSKVDDSKVQSSQQPNLA